MQWQKRVNLLSPAHPHPDPLGIMEKKKNAWPVLLTAAAQLAFLPPAKASRPALTPIPLTQAANFYNAEPYSAELFEICD